MRGIGIVEVPMEFIKVGEGKWEEGGEEFDAGRRMMSFGVWIVHATISTVRFGEVEGFEIDGGPNGHPITTNEADGDRKQLNLNQDTEDSRLLNRSKASTWKPFQTYHLRCPTEHLRRHGISKGYFSLAEVTFSTISTKYCGNSYLCSFYLRSPPIRNCLCRDVHRSKHLSCPCSFYSIGRPSQQRYFRRALQQPCFSLGAADTPLRPIYITVVGGTDSGN